MQDITNENTTCNLTNNITIEKICNAIDTINCSNSVIYCYTGTGNSFAASKQFSKFFDGIEIKFITQELVDNPETVKKDFGIIVVPSYAYGVPKLVKRWLKKARFYIDYLAVAVLQGSSQRGTGAEVAKLLKRQKQQVAYSSGVDSMENYVHLFGHPKPEKAEKRAKDQHNSVARLCEIYKNREVKKIKTFRPLSAFVSFIFRTAKVFFPLRYRTTKTCNGCEICRKVCPPDAIVMREKKGRKIPKFKALRCDHCQACMQLCPSKSIKFFRIKPKSPRYKHKDCALKELIKRD